MKLTKWSVFLIASLLMMLFMSDQALGQWKSVRGNGKIVKQNREVSGFSAIKVSCSADVFLKQGKETAVTVRADENILEMVETEVSGNTLKIDIDGSISNCKALEVYITVVELDKVEINGSGDVVSENQLEGIDFEISINGSGDVDLDLSVKNLETKINGSGDVDVSGVQGNFYLKVSGSGDFSANDLRLDQCEIEIYGSGDVQLEGSASEVSVQQSASGDVDLYNLKSGDVDVHTSGSGDVIVYVSGVLKVRLSGSGDVTYKGDPKSVDASASGSGEVYHR